MGYSLQRAGMEAQLAAAHRALYRALNFAEEGGIYGAVEDIDLLLGEVTRVAQCSLKGSRASRELKGQLKLPT